MTHWKITLSYDGTGFHGWQVQPGLRTIQGTLAEVLHHMTGETVLPQGSGRTDAGVHALAQVASFRLEAPIPADRLHRALNRALPEAIRILAVEQTPQDFHARHSARGKTYEYRIFPAADAICSPILAPFCWSCRWPLQLRAAQQAAQAMVGEHDFSSFAASDPDRTHREPGASTPDNVRTIFRSDWTLEAGLLIYRVAGSGFLHHMVRNLVGTFVEVAAGRLQPGRILPILAARDRSAAGPTAPARGLFLLGVDY